MPTRALSGARMVRDLGVSNEFLAANVASATKIQQVASDRFISRGLANTSTGNVQGEQPWYDVQVPDWTTGAHITNFSTLQYYLSSVAETNSLIPASAVYTETYGNFSFAGSSLYEGGVLAPNGKIYFMPNVGATIGSIIDPSNNSISTYGTFPGNQANLGGVLAPNGKIYQVAYTQSIGRIIDPSNNTITTYGGFPAVSPANAAWHSGVIANGKIYCDPHNATVGAIVDPSNNTVTTYGSFPGSAAYHGAVLSPNNKVYFVPHNATIGRLVDPSNNTVTTYGSFPGSGAYIGGVLAPNGLIYFSPHNATIGRLVDPSNNTITTYGSFPGSGAYHGGPALMSNGVIMLSPYNATIGRVIDPSNNTVITYGNVPGSAAYMGSVSAPNGKVYFVPHLATSGMAVFLLTNNNFNINVFTNPFFNKY